MLDGRGAGRPEAVASQIPQKGKRPRLYVSNDVSQRWKGGSFGICDGDVVDLGALADGERANTSYTHRIQLRTPLHLRSVTYVSSNVTQC